MIFEIAKGLLEVERKHFKSARRTGLFDEFENMGSTIQTIHAEDYFQGGWNEYENYVSDHRPVGLKLNFNQQGQ